MNRVYIFTNSKDVIMHKILAWVLSFFILINSFSVGKTAINVSLTDTAKISAEALVTQFFYISTLPLNIITKLFVETDNTVAVPLAPAKDNKKSSKNDNAAQASSEYSIVPVMDLSQFTKVKNFSFSGLQDKVKKSKCAAFFSCVFYSVGFTIGDLLKLNIIMLLLLAILLTRRNIGDDNIILSIKNNTFARLV